MKGLKYSLKVVEVEERLVFSAVPSLSFSNPGGKPDYNRLSELPNSGVGGPRGGGLKTPQSPF